MPKGAAPLLELDRFRTLVIPDGEQAMAWTIGDSGFEMVLGAAVPQVLAKVAAAPRLLPASDDALRGVMSFSAGVDDTLRLLGRL